MKRPLAYAIIMVLLLGVAAWWVTDYRQFDFNEAPYNECHIQSIRVLKQTQTVEISNPEQYTDIVLSMLREHTYRRTSESEMSGDSTLEISFLVSRQNTPIVFIIGEQGDIAITDVTTHRYKLGKNAKTAKELYNRIYTLLKDQLPPELQ